MWQPVTRLSHDDSPWEETATFDIAWSKAFTTNMRNFVVVSSCNMRCKIEPRTNLHTSVLSFRSLKHSNSACWHYLHFWYHYTCFIIICLSKHSRDKQLPLVHNNLMRSSILWVSKIFRKKSFRLGKSTHLNAPHVEPNKSGTKPTALLFLNHRWFAPTRGCISAAHPCKLSLEPIHLQAL